MNSDKFTFCDGKSVWLVKDLWAAAEGLTVQQVTPDSLERRESIFDHPTKAKEWAAEFQRVLRADLEYPIILTPAGWIADGMHRLIKAHYLGCATVKVVRLTEMPAPIPTPGVY
jgi:hypothetical protein